MNGEGGDGNGRHESHELVCRGVIGSQTVALVQLVARYRGEARRDDQQDQQQIPRAASLDRLGDREPFVTSVLVVVAVAYLAQGMVSVGTAAVDWIPWVIAGAAASLASSSRRSSSD